MADPLSVIASILGVASAGVKLSTGLYDLIQRYNGAQDSIEDIASDLNYFAIFLEELAGMLNVPASQNVASDRLLSTIGEIMENCRFLFKNINKMIFRADSSMKMKITQKIGWVFREKKVRTVRATLDGLKTTLASMLQALVVRKLMDSSAGDNTLAKEEAVLKNLLNTQQYSLRRLQRVEKTKKAGIHGESKAETAPVTSSPETSGFYGAYQSTYEMPEPHISQDDSLTSTLLSRAVPYVPERQPDTKPQQTTHVLGFHAPAHSSTIKSLLDEWTRSSAIAIKSSAAQASEMGPRDQQEQNSRPAAENQRPFPGREVTEGMEALAMGLQEGVIEKIHENAISQHALQKDYEKRKELAEQAVASELKTIEASHYAAVYDLENKLFVKESKEATISSLKLEIERTHKELHKRTIGHQTAESDPLALHAARLGERLTAEVSEVTILKTDLAEGRKRAKEDYESKLAGLAYLEISKEESSKHEKQLEAIKEERVGWEDLLKTSAEDSIKVKSQWLDLMKKIQHFDLDIRRNTVETKPQIPTVSPDWLDDGVDDAQEDEDDDEPEDDWTNSKIFVDPAEPIQPTNSEKIPVDPETPTPAAFSDKIFEPPPPPISEKVPTTEDVHEVDAGAIEIADRCWRQAWKPPQPFRSGFNTLSAIMRMNTERLWFKASRDEYRFFLGPTKDPFYTIELVPTDLRSFQTSKFEWTVLQKAWASSEALSASGYTYKEDSDGHYWIQKELTWFQIEQLFDISCGFLDNLLTVASRKVLEERSEENGGLLKTPQSPRPRGLSRLRRSRGSNEADIHTELHGAFFRSAAA